MEIVLAVVGGATGAAIISLVQACIERRWKKEDAREDDLKAIARAQKVIIIDRVRYMVQKYANRPDGGSMSLMEKETIDEMHQVYEDLLKIVPGNSHLDSVMDVADNLAIKENSGYGV